MNINKSDISFYILISICMVGLICVLVATTCLYYFVCNMSLGISILCTSITAAVAVLGYLLTKLVCWLILK